MLIALLLALAAVAFGLVLGRSAIQQRLDDLRPLAVSGRLLMPADNGLAVYDFARRQQSLLVQVEPGQTVTAVTWSPDGTQLAYGFFHRRPEDPALVGEIYAANADGSGPHPIAERDRPGAVLDSPLWSPDGRYIYFSYLGLSAGRSIQRVERVQPDGGGRQALVDNGYQPAVSPDGASLLFLRDERGGTGLYVMPADGSGQPRPVLPAGRYPGLAGPRFSPDGQRIAVAILNASMGQAPPNDLFAWLMPVAYAHGLPWDIWSFNVDGGDPRQLTHINADDPSSAWSPDGTHIAIWGGTGLYVVGADGSDLHQVLDRGGYGAPDWGR
jgi:Tol biopolymer transport system component